MRKLRHRKVKSPRFTQQVSGMFFFTSILFKALFLDHNTGCCASFTVVNYIRLSRPFFWMLYFYECNHEGNFPSEEKKQKPYISVIAGQQVVFVFVCFLFLIYLILQHFKKFIYLFWKKERERERESEGGAERHTEREFQAGCVRSAWSPVWDSNSQIARPWPEPKPRAGRSTDWATQAPLKLSLYSRGYVPDFERIWWVDWTQACWQLH